jgi:flagellar hook-basal body complex protein FliE
MISPIGGLGADPTGAAALSGSPYASGTSAAGTTAAQALGATSAVDPTAQTQAISGIDPNSTAATSVPTSGSGSFSNALSNAIGSLENSQANATTASQQLATGQLTDPTKAITSVENASLAMDFASQIRNKLDSAVTTIFQTQV